MSKAQSDCQYCDVAGGIKTYENQVSMPLNGKVRCIDYCIHRIVAALNAGGVRTTASCCGHGRILGNIGLEDGREIIIHTEPINWCDTEENLAAALKKTTLD